ncbi:hypothetical protein N0V83_004221 [Neocucurbitaria cava]|uniref:Uncharacterized protein n=1 Tax=Neocucurbitaria cava TaxID=798079 RepID=A0A9W8YBJ0_9PLEO|nr:hypothetical protein N0V83_004221 [Neocucurbitaria cava]
MDPSHRVSDVATKAKAFASLGLGSPRNTKIEDAPAHLTLRGKKLRPLSRGDPVVDDGLENNELANKIQQLSFAQDYHEVLADQYHKLHALQPEVADNDQGQTLQSLSCMKGSNGLSSAKWQAPSASERKPRHKRMKSWVHLHYLNDSQQRRDPRDEVHQRSISDSAVPRKKKILESEIDRLLGKEIRLRHLLAQTRGFKFNKRRPKAASPERPVKPSPHPALLPSPRLEQPMPLLRLPGGFALVRQSPSETSQPRTASSHDASPLADITRGASNISSVMSISDTSRPRSSLYSQHWQVPVAPTIAVNNSQRNSMGSVQSFHSRSSSSSPPTSPLAHEIALPRTPPPIPSLSARVPRATPSSPTSPNGSEKRNQGDFSETEEDHDTHVHRILDRARGARDAWRSHQRELRQERLKQSIKVLGPTDPTVVAGYVKREGRRTGYDEGDGGRMPGYLMSGPV